MQLATTIEAMDNSETIVKRVSVPLGLEEIMEGLTREVMIVKPSDLYTFASDYCYRMLSLRKAGHLPGLSGRTATSATKESKILQAKHSDLTKYWSQMSYIPPVRLASFGHNKSHIKDQIIKTIYEKYKGRNFSNNTKTDSAPSDIKENKTPTVLSIDKTKKDEGVSLIMPSASLRESINKKDLQKQEDQTEVSSKKTDNKLTNSSNTKNKKSPRDNNKIKHIPNDNGNKSIKIKSTSVEKTNSNEKDAAKTIRKTKSVLVKPSKGLDNSQDQGVTVVTTQKNSVQESKSRQKSISKESVAKVISNKNTESVKQKALSSAEKSLKLSENKEKINEELGTENVEEDKENEANSTQSQISELNSIDSNDTDANEKHKQQKDLGDSVEFDDTISQLADDSTVTSDKDSNTNIEHSSESSVRDIHIKQPSEILSKEQVAEANVESTKSPITSQIYKKIANVVDDTSSSSLLDSTPSQESKNEEQKSSLSKNSSKFHVGDGASILDTISTKDHEKALKTGDKTNRDLLDPNIKEKYEDKADDKMVKVVETNSSFDMKKLKKEITQVAQINNDNSKNSESKKSSNESPKPFKESIATATCKNISQSTAGSAVQEKILQESNKDIVKDKNAISHSESTSTNGDLSMNKTHVQKQIENSESKIVNLPTGEDNLMDNFKTNSSGGELETLEAGNKDQKENNANMESKDQKTNKNDPNEHENFDLNQSINKEEEASKSQPEEIFHPENYNNIKPTSSLDINKMKSQTQESSQTDDSKKAVEETTEETKRPPDISNMKQPSNQSEIIHSKSESINEGKSSKEFTLNNESVTDIPEKPITEESNVVPNKEHTPKDNASQYRQVTSKAQLNDSKIDNPDESSSKPLETEANLQNTIPDVHLESKDQNNTDENKSKEISKKNSQFDKDSNIEKSASFDINELKSEIQEVSQIGDPQKHTPYKTGPGNKDKISTESEGKINEVKFPNFVFEDTENSNQTEQGTAVNNQSKTNSPNQSNLDDNTKPIIASKAGEEAVPLDQESSNASLLGEIRNQKHEANNKILKTEENVLGKKTASNNLENELHEEAERFNDRKDDTNKLPLTDRDKSITTFDINQLKDEVKEITELRDSTKNVTKGSTAQPINEETLSSISANDCPPTIKKEDADKKINDSDKSALEGKNSNASPAGSKSYDEEKTISKAYKTENSPQKTASEKSALVIHNQNTINGNQLHASQTEKTVVSLEKIKKSMNDTGKTEVENLNQKKKPKDFIAGTGKKVGSVEQLPETVKTVKNSKEAQIDKSEEALPFDINKLKNEIQKVSQIGDLKEINDIANNTKNEVENQFGVLNEKISTTAPDNNSQSKIEKVTEDKIYEESREETHKGKIQNASSGDSDTSHAERPAPEDTTPSIVKSPPKIHPDKPQKNRNIGERNKNQKSSTTFKDIPREKESGKINNTKHQSNKDINSKEISKLVTKEASSFDINKLKHEIEEVSQTDEAKIINTTKSTEEELANRPNDLKENTSSTPADNSKSIKRAEDNLLEDAKEVSKTLSSSSGDDKSFGSEKPVTADNSGGIEKSPQENYSDMTQNNNDMSIESKNQKYDKVFKDISTHGDSKKVDSSRSNEDKVSKEISHLDSNHEAGNQSQPATSKLKTEIQEVSQVVHTRKTNDTEIPSKNVSNKSANLKENNSSTTPQKSSQSTVEEVTEDKLLKKTKVDIHDGKILSPSSKETESFHEEKPVTKENAQIVEKSQPVSHSDKSVREANFNLENKIPNNTKISGEVEIVNSSEYESNKDKDSEEIPHLKIDNTAEEKSSFDINKLKSEIQEISQEDPIKNEPSENSEEKLSSSTSKNSSQSSKGEVSIDKLLYSKPEAPNSEKLKTKDGTQGIDQVKQEKEKLIKDEVTENNNTSSRVNQTEIKENSQSSLDKLEEVKQPKSGAKEDDIGNLNDKNKDSGKLSRKDIDNNNVKDSNGSSSFDSQKLRSEISNVTQKNSPKANYSTLNSTENNFVGKNKNDPDLSEDKNISTASTQSMQEKMHTNKKSIEDGVQDEYSTSQSLHHEFKETVEKSKPKENIDNIGNSTQQESSEKVISQQNSPQPVLINQPREEDIDRSDQSSEIIKKTQKLGTTDNEGQETNKTYKQMASDLAKVMEASSGLKEIDNNIDDTKADRESHRSSFDAHKLRAEIDQVNKVNNSEKDTVVNLNKITDVSVENEQFLDKQIKETSAVQINDFIRKEQQHTTLVDNESIKKDPSLDQGQIKTIVDSSNKYSDNEKVSVELLNNSKLPSKPDDRAVVSSIENNLQIKSEVLKNAEDHSLKPNEGAETQFVNDQKFETTLKTEEDKSQPKFMDNKQEEINHKTFTDNTLRRNSKELKDSKDINIKSKDTDENITTIKTTEEKEITTPKKDQEVGKQFSGEKYSVDQHKPPENVADMNHQNALEGKERSLHSPDARNSSRDISDFLKREQEHSAFQLKSEKNIQSEQLSPTFDMSKLKKEIEDNTTTDSDKSKALVGNTNKEPSSKTDDTHFIPSKEKYSQVKEHDATKSEDQLSNLLESEPNQGSNTEVANNNKSEAILKPEKDKLPQDSKISDNSLRKNSMKDSEYTSIKSKDPGEKIETNAKEDIETATLVSNLDFGGQIKDEKDNLGQHKLVEKITDKNTLKSTEDPENQSADMKNYLGINDFLLREQEHSAVLLESENNKKFEQSSSKINMSRPKNEIQEVAKDEMKQNNETPSSKSSRSEKLVVSDEQSGTTDNVPEQNEAEIDHGLIESDKGATLGEERSGRSRRDLSNLNNHNQVAHLEKESSNEIILRDENKQNEEGNLTDKKEDVAIVDEVDTFNYSLSKNGGPNEQPSSSPVASKAITKIEKREDAKALAMLNDADEIQKNEKQPSKPVNILENDENKIESDEINDEKPNVAKDISYERKLSREAKADDDTIISEINKPIDKDVNETKENSNAENEKNNYNNGDISVSNDFSSSQQKIQEIHGKSEIEMDADKNQGVIIETPENQSGYQGENNIAGKLREAMPETKMENANSVNKNVMDESKELNDGKFYKIASENQSKEKLSGAKPVSRNVESNSSNENTVRPEVPSNKEAVDVDVEKLHEKLDTAKTNAASTLDKASHILRDKKLQRHISPDKITSRQSSSEQTGHTTGTRKVKPDKTTTKLLTTEKKSIKDPDNVTTVKEATKIKNSKQRSSSHDKFSNISQNEKNIDTRQAKKLNRVKSETSVIKKESNTKISPRSKLQNYNNLQDMKSSTNSIKLASSALSADKSESQKIKEIKKHPSLKKGISKEEVKDLSTVIISGKKLLKKDNDPSTTASNHIDVAVKNEGNNSEETNGSYGDKNSLIDKEVLKSESTDPKLEKISSDIQREGNKYEINEENILRTNRNDTYPSSDENFENNSSLNSLDGVKEDTALNIEIKHTNQTPEESVLRTSNFTDNSREPIETMALNKKKITDTQSVNLSLSEEENLNISASSNSSSGCHSHSTAVELSSSPKQSSGPDVALRAKEIATEKVKPTSPKNLLNSQTFKEENSIKTDKENRTTSANKIDSSTFSNKTGNIAEVSRNLSSNNDAVISRNIENENSMQPLQSKPAHDVYKKNQIENDSVVPPNIEESNNYSQHAEEDIVNENQTGNKNQLSNELSNEESAIKTLIQPSTNIQGAHHNPENYSTDTKILSHENQYKAESTDSAIPNQVHAREHHTTTAEDTDKFHKAAIKIQALFRAFQVRKHTKTRDVFGNSIPSEKHPKEVLEECIAKHKNSAVKIQKVWRGYNVRKNIKDVKKKFADLQTDTDKSNQKEISDMDIFRAASKIQAAAKGYMLRKDIKKANNLLSISEESSRLSSSKDDSLLRDKSGKTDISNDDLTNDDEISKYLKEIDKISKTSASPKKVHNEAPTKDNRLVSSVPKDIKSNEESGLAKVTGTKSDHINENKKESKTNKKSSTAAKASNITESNKQESPQDIGSKKISDNSEITGETEDDNKNAGTFNLENLRHEIQIASKVTERNELNSSTLETETKHNKQVYESKVTSLGNKGGNTVNDNVKELIKEKDISVESQASKAIIPAMSRTPSEEAEEAKKLYETAPTRPVTSNLTNSIDNSSNKSDKMTSHLETIPDSFVPTAGGKDTKDGLDNLKNKISTLSSNAEPALPTTGEKIQTAQVMSFDKVDINSKSRSEEGDVKNDSTEKDSFDSKDSGHSRPGSITSATSVDSTSTVIFVPESERSPEEGKSKNSTESDAENPLDVNSTRTEINASSDQNNVTPAMKNNDQIPNSDIEGDDLIVADKTTPSDISTQNLKVVPIDDTDIHTETALKNNINSEDNDFKEGKSSMEKTNEPTVIKKEFALLNEKENPATSNKTEVKLTNTTAEINATVEEENSSSVRGKDTVNINTMPDISKLNLNTTDNDQSNDEEVIESPLNKEKNKSNIINKPNDVNNSSNVKDVNEEEYELSGKNFDEESVLNKEHGEKISQLHKQHEREPSGSVSNFSMNDLHEEIKQAQSSSQDEISGKNLQTKNDLKDSGKDKSENLSKGESSSDAKLKEDSAATMIQSLYRGHRVRRDLDIIKNTDSGDLKRFAINRELSAIKEEDCDEKPNELNAKVKEENINEEKQQLGSQVFHEPTKETASVDQEEKIEITNAKQEDLNSREENQSRGENNTALPEERKQNATHEASTSTNTSTNSWHWAKMDETLSQENHHEEQETRNSEGNSSPQRLAVQVDQPPAGTETVTSERPDDDAQLPLRDGPARGIREAVQPEMEREKHNNAAFPKRNMEQAATKIQAGFRGYQVRKQLRQKNTDAPSDETNQCLLQDTACDEKTQRRSIRRKSSGRLTESTRTNQVKPVKEVEEKSAVKIQAGVRGFLVRRRQKKMKPSE